MPPRSRRRPGWKSLICCTRRRSSAGGVIACAEGATAFACGGVLARAPSMPIAGVEGRSSKFAALQACRCDPARYEGCISVCARARRRGQRVAQPAAAPPRDQLTLLDRRKCPHGVIKLETTRLFWLMSPSAPKAAVARTLLDFAFVPIPDVKSEGSANQLTRP